jgi:hypothetical protein
MCKWVHMISNGVSNICYCSLIVDPQKLEKLKAADFALFASHWWPNAHFPELRILAFLSIWLFVWDDEIDETTGTLTDDYDASQEFRRQTIAYLEQCLELSTCEEHLIPASAIIRSFRVIGDALCADYNMGIDLYFCYIFFYP